MKDWSRKVVHQMCEMCSERKPDVLRFGLIRHVTEPRNTTFGAGSISLCERCWEGLSSRRQRRPAA